MQCCDVNLNKHIVYKQHNIGKKHKQQATNIQNMQQTNS